LQAEGYAYNCNAAYKADAKSRCRKFYPAEYYPQNIQKQAARPAAVYNFLSEGEKRDFRHFEALDTDGDTRDSDAPQKPHYEPEQKHNKPAENDPDYVADKFHKYAPFLIHDSQRLVRETL